MNDKTVVGSSNEQIPNDDFLRRYWRINGGDFHGPNVETGTMPEAKLLPLLRTLLDMGSPPETKGHLSPDDWNPVEIPLEEVVSREVREVVAPNDTAALTKLAAALRPIIERDEQRGMPTTGLENAAREIEWAARRDRPTGSNEHPMTLGRLLLETARGSVKERTVTGAELAEIRANMVRYFKGPLHFREPLDESGAPYIYDANGNAVAMLMWPEHPVEETAAAEQATYAMGRAMAAVVGGDAAKANEPPRCGYWLSGEHKFEENLSTECRCGAFVKPSHTVAVRSNWSPSKVADGWDCYTCGSFITHKQDAAEVEKDCTKCGPSAQKANEGQS